MKRSGPGGRLGPRKPRDPSFRGFAAIIGRHLSRRAGAVGTLFVVGAGPSDRQVVDDQAGHRAELNGRDGLPALPVGDVQATRIRRYGEHRGELGGQDRRGGPGLP